jgi:hypothetical protein
MSSSRVMRGATFLFVAWAAEAIVAGLWLGPLWVAPVFLGALATGYVALRFEELARDTAEALRHLWLRAFHFDTARRLGERRRALAEAVESALREAA